MFAPWESATFDVVAFNPPFFERAQGGLLELALCDAPGLPIFTRFLQQLHDHLAARGIAYIAGSTEGALQTMRTAYADAGWSWQVAATKERLSERLVIDALREP